MRISSLALAGLLIVPLGVLASSYAFSTEIPPALSRESHATTVVKDAACKASTDQFREWAKMRDSKLSRLEQMAWLDDASGILSEISRSTSAERAAAIKASSMANSIDALTVLAKADGGKSVSAKVDGAATASQCGNVEALQVLLKSGVSPNSVHTSGSDLMFISLANRHFGAANLLMDMGYNACAFKGTDGRSAREFASSMGAGKLAARMEACKQER